MVRVAPLLVLAACVTPTPAVVTRIAQPSADAATATLIGCQLFLGWDEAQLVANCGQPDAKVAWMGRPTGICFIYRTTAKSFATGTGVEVVAACFGDVPQSTNLVERSHPKHYLETIFGLAADAMSGLGAPAANVH